MKRTMFQLYLRNCDEAIKFYMKAFDAAINTIYKDPDNNSVVHAEINAFGQCIAFCERDTETNVGNTMQFCFHFGEGNEEIVERAYDVLKEGAQIDFPLGPCFYSPCMFGLIDKFGVNWCLFV